MSIDIKAPTFPESIADGAVLTWHKQPGESVERDESLVDIETDKVVLEVVAPADGALESILKNEGDTVLSEEVLAVFVEGAGSSEAKADSKDEAKEKPKDEAKEKDAEKKPAEASASKAADKPAESAADKKVNPAAKKMAEERGVDLSQVQGSAKDGRITKADVMDANKNMPAANTVDAAIPEMNVGERVEKRVPMTRLRAKIAERLLSATQETAMLTTFNEVNMAPIMALRNKYKEEFEKAHDGTRLGFMSFFVRAAVEALKRFPAVNSSIDGTDVVYHGYQDIGIAVSSDRGLVVPVLRDVDDMGLADIEASIRSYGLKARDGKLGLNEMQGGTFTITNGGVFGSLVSTPILNPPQAAILGMHTIQDRPVAEDGEVVIRPMMYLALSYDHRLIDGKDAVQFLVAIKNMIEDPARILLAL